MPERPAYRDASLSPDRRAEDLLARMDRDEKIGQLCSVWLTLDPASGDFAPFQGMFMRTPVDQRGVDPPNLFVRSVRRAQQAPRERGCQGGQACLIE